MAMFRHSAQKRARILSKSEFRHALKVASVTSDPERNQLLLCLSHALAMRVSEMARITEPSKASIRHAFEVAL